MYHNSVLRTKCQLISFLIIFFWRINSRKRFSSKGYLINYCTSFCPLQIQINLSTSTFDFNRSWHKLLWHTKASIFNLILSKFQLPTSSIKTSFCNPCQCNQIYFQTFWCVFSNKQLTSWAIILWFMGSFRCTINWWVCVLYHLCVSLHKIYLLFSLKV